MRYRTSSFWSRGKNHNRFYSRNNERSSSVLNYRSGDDMEKMRCPRCGYPDLVRARVRTLGGIVLKPGARCVTCGYRFHVSRTVFKKLRYAALAEPYGTVDDLDDYMHHFPLTRTQIVTCSIAALLGLVVGVWLANIWDSLLVGWIFFPILYCGWWLGRWISPASRIVPGRCPKCLYNLRGIGRSRCPECGTTIDLEQARDEGAQTVD